ncbi:Protein FAR1-RELATED SEQUENCE 8, partial [Bienertia sinuspersici]
WVVQIHKVELAHKNHAPSPSKSRNVPTFRDVLKFVIRIVKDLIDAGVRQSQIYYALTSQLNGFENITFLLKDMHNAVQKDRCKEFDEHECHENKLKDVVWVDARSRAVYLDFGDVICFDATYITNRYELPFANFVGVNQHGKSILLGCSLIRSEDSNTYKWVMREWSQCMGDVQPGGIITDQSTPMANAIQEVLSNSRHRLCVWRILSKVPRNVLAMKNVGEFHKNMKEVGVRIPYTRRLEGNEWLNGLWEDRRHWIPAYVNDIF